MIGGITAINHHFDPLMAATIAAISETAATIGITTDITYTFVMGARSRIKNQMMQMIARLTMQQLFASPLFLAATDCRIFPES